MNAIEDYGYFQQSFKHINRLEIIHFDDGGYKENYLYYFIIIHVINPYFTLTEETCQRLLSCEIENKEYKSTILKTLRSYRKKTISKDNAIKKIDNSIKTDTIFSESRLKNYFSIIRENNLYIYSTNLNNFRFDNSEQLISKLIKLKDKNTNTFNNITKTIGIEEKDLMLDPNELKLKLYNSMKQIIYTEYLKPIKK